MRNNRKIFTIIIFMNLFVVSRSLSEEIKDNSETKRLKNFPKILGMNIGKKHYDDESYQKDLSRNDIVILGFYREWEKFRNTNIKEVSQRLKRLNPNILIGQYTILNEFTDNIFDQAKRDIIEKLNKENWWLLDEKKKKLQWTPRYNAWEVNFTEYTQVDSGKMRFPEWLAERNYNVFFKNNPYFDIWYIDNLFYKPRVEKADWKNIHKNESSSSEEIQRAYRKGYMAYLEKAKQLSPQLLYIVNADSELNYEEYRNQFHGAFLEGLMGYSWSLETWAGWERMMERYHSVFENLLPPKIVGFHATGDPKDRKFVRYALTSCLMNNGYFSFTDKWNEYSSVAWLEEFDLDLGSPIEEPKKKPWREHVYRREFEKGVVYVNPGMKPYLLKLEKNMKLACCSEKKIENGKDEKKIILNPKDGLILMKIDE